LPPDGVVFPSQRQSTPMRDLTGTTVLHYRILERVGEGGMGVVYRAEDTRLKRSVALKFLPPDLTRDPEAKARFTQEAQAASSLQHINICTIHDINETEEGQLFICMDLYEGETLRERIERGPLPVEEGMGIAVQIAQGLARAHEKGIVHRDVKPANIFVSNDGIIRILDFGLAKLSGQSRITREGSTLGTAAYMSPEQARGDEVDQRADIWALGAVLYEMFTGQLPFKTEYQTALVYSILNEDPEPPTAIRAEIRDELETVILKSLEKDPGERYASGAEMLSALQELQLSGPSAVKPGDPRRILTQLLKRPVVASALVVIVLGGVAAGAWMLDRSAKSSRAKEELLPEVRKALQFVPFSVPLAEFALAQEAREYIGDDPEFEAVWEKIAATLSVETDPPGAEIEIRYVGTPNAAWIPLGVSPVLGREVPSRFLQLRITKQGYVQREDVLLPFFSSDSYVTPSTREFALDSLGSIPEGMARVYGDTALGDFLMDRCEVNNSQYREFVLAGGYSNRSFWKEPFTDDGRRIPWENAMSSFVDATGRPGPSTWRAGSYPDGEDDYPVRGVSWYEAAAYAEFAGKKLPSTAHWELASVGGESFYTLYFDQYIIPLSNFSATGARPVGSGDMFGPYGLWDMAGNVREWCWNESVKGRCLRGGAWNDATYMYRNITQASPFDRSERNGFRCMVPPAGVKPPPDVFDPVTLDEGYDLRTVDQVSDDVFQIYRGLYEYDRIPLESAIEFRDESSNDWVKEKVSFNILNADERMPAYLFLPKNAAPPFQTVVYFPGGWAARVASSRDVERQAHFVRSVQYLIKSGRAVVHPVAISMYERSLPDSVRGAMGPHQFMDYRIRIVREYSRTIDYLESRPDIDAEKLAYYGMSWGGSYANLVLAVEDRFKAAIVEVGGLRLEPRVRPEVRLLYYTPRITVPVLMLNGEYDLAFPLELNVKPMFEMIATPEEHKRLVVYPTDHFVPPDEFLKESLAWLDRYLGPVQYK
jgi:serine/threonine protein kinase/dienelactone hydrolase